MVAPRPRKNYGQAEIDAAVTEIINKAGSDANDDIIRSLVVTALDMDTADVDRLDLKIASQSLVEILNAWKVFSPYSDRAKVTIFGSARTEPDHPDYKLAVEFGRLMKERDWMAITGAGPGIMTAGIEGITKENSFGVNIILPFEQNAAEIIRDDEKLATFRYFFTRKLTFMKETDAFALFPGGFGTLDEAFELLTLIQTGKSYPAPIVLLDSKGSTYWQNWSRLVEDELLAGGLISEADTGMYLHTQDPEEAVEYLCSFYSCYHSVRYVKNKLIIRLHSELPDTALETLTKEFSDIIVSGKVERCEPTKAEKRSNDNLSLPRISLLFDNRSFARLMKMIERINELGGKEGASAATNLIHDVSPEPDETEGL